MTLLVGSLIIIVTTALAVGALLAVRTRAPDGGFFNDSDRAAGVFGVLATGFAVLLGFVVFLAFASFDASRAGAESEALLVVQQFETAQFLDKESASELGGQLICYGRYVAETEWQQLEDGSLEEEVNPWSIVMFQTFQEVEPEGPAEEAAYSKWLDQTSEREQARLDRVHGGEGVIPTSLWIVLFLAAAVIFVYMLFFADAGERAFIQGLQIGTVTAVIVATLLLINALNTPFRDGVGGLRPVSMERSLDILESVSDIGVSVTPPCSEDGEPL
jgi:hypothetical protein